MIKAAIELEPKFFADVLSTIIDSNIADWAEGRNFEHTNDGDYLRCEMRPHRQEGLVFDEGDKRNDWIEIGYAEVEAAMQKVINHQAGVDGAKPLCTPYIAKYILDAVLEQDAGHIDAEAADVIIQVALFDEIVFG